MSIGNKIREYRTKNNLTQKDLAEALNVTYQAVSRWETEDVEPSYDTLKKMASIFNCSMDDLFETNVEEDDDNYYEVKDEVTEENTNNDNSKVVLGVCVDCNKPIYDSSDLNRVEVHHGGGRGHGSHWTTDIVCNECLEKRNAAKEAKEQALQEEIKHDYKSRRIHSFIWSPLFALIVGLIVFLADKQYTDSVYIPIKILFVIGAFTFMSCVIMFNNFIPEMFVGIAKFSIKLPGIIFSLDLDGLIWFLTIKLGLLILSIIGSIFMFFIALIFSFAISILVYPFALAKSFKCEDID